MAPVPPGGAAPAQYMYFVFNKKGDNQPSLTLKCLFVFEEISLLKLESISRTNIIVFLFWDILLLISQNDFLILRNIFWFKGGLFFCLFVCFGVFFVYFFGGFFLILRNIVLDSKFFSLLKFDLLAFVAIDKEELVMVFTKLALMKPMPRVYLYFFILLLCNCTKSSLDLQRSSFNIWLGCSHQTNVFQR